MCVCVFVPVAAKTLHACHIISCILFVMLRKWHKQQHCFTSIIEAFRFSILNIFLLVTDFMLFLYPQQFLIISVISKTVVLFSLKIINHHQFVTHHLLNSFVSELNQSFILNAFTSVLFLDIYSFETPMLISTYH